MDARWDFLSDLTDLVISDHETGGAPVLPPGSRPRVQLALERMLVSRAALSGHVRELRDRFGVRSPRVEPPTDEQIRAVLDGGLDALDDGALAALALNPIALDRLGREIDEWLPDAWLDAMEREGRAELVRHRGRVPSIEEIVGEARTEEPAGLVAATFEGQDRVPAERPWRWTVEVPLARAEWLGREDAAEVARLEGQRVRVEYSWWAGRTPPTLDVRLGGPLTLGPARCVGRLEDASGAARADAEADGVKLSFALPGVSMAELDRWALACDYRLVGRYHLGFRAPLRGGAAEG